MRLCRNYSMRAIGRMRFLSEMLRFAILGMIAMVGGSAVALEARAPCVMPVDSSPEALRWDGGRHLCYLEALVENLERLDKAANDDAAILQGDLAIYLAMIGEDGASRSMISDMGSARPGRTPGPAEGVDATDAVEAILTRAADRHYLILNEAHHNPRHRDLVRHLLPGLKAAGYTHLAAEGLAHDLSFQDANGPVTAESGWYLRDPIYARLIREARAAGLIIVPYEAGPTSGRSEDRIAAMQARETTQAEQLFARTIGAHPSARTVVLVGYDHIEEAPRQRSDGKGVFMWMAAELKRLSGTDPLTVDQTTFNEQADTDLEAAQYRALVPLTSGMGSVLVDESGSPIVLGRYAGRVDLQVVYPPSQGIRGREAWRWTGMTPLEVALPPGAHAQDLYLAQAFLLETQDAVPVDQTLLSAEEPRPLLVAKPDAVRIEVTPVPAGLKNWLLTRP